MRRLAALTLLLAFTAACGSSPATGLSPVVSPTPAHAPTPDNPAPTPTPIPESATPLPAPVGSPAKAWGILVRLSDTAYDVSLIAVDGSHAASAHPVRRTSFSVSTPNGPQLPIELPYVSATRSRVYYLDGESTVRSLAPGTTDQPVVATLPGSAKAHAAFAVSPDDSKIAVSIVDFGGAQPKVTLLVGPLGGQLNQIFSSTTDFVWPVAWHAGDIVLATLDRAPYENTELALNPYRARSFHIVDPANANRIAVIGHPEDNPGFCWPSGVLTVAGTACYLSAFNGQTGAYAILDWQGNRYLQPAAASWNSAPSVAPQVSTGTVIVCCQDNASDGQFVLPSSAGTTTTPLRGLAGDWACWIDMNHVMSVSSAPPGASGVVWEVSTGHIATIGGDGRCAGVLPTDLG